MMKNQLLSGIAPCITLAAAIFVTGSAQAAEKVCGVGQIQEFRMTSGYTSNTNFAIKLSGGTQSGMNYYDTNYIVVVYNEQIRFTSLFSLAHAAFLAGAPVKIITRDGNNCTANSQQTEIRVCSPGDSAGCQK